MKDKVVLITGATSGIGKETAIALSKMGATIVMTARDMKSGEAARADIVRASGNNKVEFFLCDLSSFKSIRFFVENFSKTYDRINILINNAGVGSRERKLSLDGFELHWAVNFLAPFLLTNLLLSVLKKGAPARIINVSSTLHKEGHINFNDLQNENNYDHYKAYANSKLALILFTKKLAEGLIGTGVTVNALHPGVINTKLTKEMMGNTNPAVRVAYGLTMDSEKTGAETTIFLASSPDVENISGEYFVRKQITKSSLESYDMSIAKKLCDLATKQTGL